MASLFFQSNFQGGQSPCVIDDACQFITADTNENAQEKCRSMGGKVVSSCCTGANCDDANQPEIHPDVNGGDDVVEDDANGGDVVNGGDDVVDGGDDVTNGGDDVTNGGDDVVDDDVEEDEDVEDENEKGEGGGGSTKVLLAVGGVSVVLLIIIFIIIYFVNRKNKK